MQWLGVWYWIYRIVIESGRFSWFGHVLDMPIERLLTCTLFSELGNGWKASQRREAMTTMKYESPNQWTLSYRRS